MLGLGSWGRVILLRTVSVIVGALHNYVYSELAAMFPKLSGGIAIYAHEAWKKYLSFVGPVAAFGYWIGWSVVLSATGVVVGFLVQAQFYPSSAAAGVVLETTQGTSSGSRSTSRSRSPSPSSSSP